MLNWEQIIKLASAIISVLATVVGLLIPLIKNTKAKKKLIGLKKLSDSLQDLVIKAEQHVNYTGDEKKEYVITRANRYAMENKLPFNEQAVSDIIESLVTVSKNVNKKQGPVVLLDHPEIGNIDIK